MSAEDQCLAELVAIVDSKDSDPAALTDGALDRYLAALQAPAGEAVLALGRLQARLIARGGTSKTRADVLDVIGERIERLLDAEQPDHR